MSDKHSDTAANEDLETRLRKDEKEIRPQQAVEDNAPVDLDRLESDEGEVSPRQGN